LTKCAKISRHPRPFSTGQVLAWITALSDSRLLIYPLYLKNFVAVGDSGKGFTVSVILWGVEFVFMWIRATA
jgi:hypothetical protein